MTDHPKDVGDDNDLAQLPLDEVCDRITSEYHCRANAMAQRIRTRLASLAIKDPAASDLQRAFAALADLLQCHQAKEDNILFPALALLAEAERTGQTRPQLAFPTVLHPIRVLEAEHARLSAAFDQLPGLTEAHARRGAAAAAWNQVLADLARFHVELRRHIQVEADVLFPRALEIDRGL